MPHQFPLKLLACQTWPECSVVTGLAYIILQHTPPTLRISLLETNNLDARQMIFCSQLTLLGSMLSHTVLYRKHVIKCKICVLFLLENPSIDAIMSCPHFLGIWPATNEFSLDRFSYIQTRPAKRNLARIRIFSLRCLQCRQSKSDTH